MGWFGRSHAGVRHILSQGDASFAWAFPGKFCLAIFSLMIGDPVTDDMEFCGAILQAGMTSIL